eukprot:TRINITY_DN5626_c0_g1_i5.p2 TRINITY_DN5626_c0_g1~~TRINITY_DN5626_c0_g1_i5.p2  ORF type:complete len:153 (-),score=26.36 TRINITY_DN5626_c0_g1_i5:35-493(-)
MQDYRQKNIQMIRNCKLILALQVLQLQKEKKKGKKAKVVTSFEFKKYPFYGFQFHPEKAQYVWLAKIKACHTVEEIEIAQYLANTFVNQARQSDHNFSSLDELNDQAIEIYQSVKVTKIFSSAFFFTRNYSCLLYTSPSPRDRQKSRMPSSA